jgi:hypothetical protein
MRTNELHSTSDELKRADLVSGLGAIVLGIGIGLMLPARMHSLAIPGLLAGVAVHGWGMLRKHKLERESGVVTPSWVAALYRTCWAILAALVGYAAWLGMR